ncbi:MAG: hypothetical protein HY678_02890 [Chloroflexi bacterium]|nr:hypothetical protein [Chloroflexota bacterium]
MAAPDPIQLQVQRSIDRGIPKKQIAIDLREMGIPDTKIALLLEVHRSTIIRWLGARRISALTPAGTARARESWPAAREWSKEFTAQEVERRTGWRSDFAVRIVRGVEMAKRRGNRWMPWFVRLWVESVERGDLAPALMAGLTVLTEWLGEPACTGLRDLILDRKPFEGEIELARLNDLREPTRIPPPTDAQRLEAEQRLLLYRNARKGFGPAARPFLTAIRDRVDSLSLESLLNLPAGGQPDPYAALAELLERWPLADVDSDMSGLAYDLTGDEGEGWGNVARLGNWQLLMRVFMHRPLNEEKVR